MKGGIHFYLAGAVILLTLAGCTRGMSFAAREESYGAAEDVDDDLSSDTSEASFGPDDPGVTLITADEGGNIDRYDSMFFGPESDTTRWAIDGYCNSACTMVLGTGRVCATPRAQFGFHAGYYKLFVFWKVINPKLTHQMYRRYPDHVKNWVDAHRAMDQITMTMMRQPEVATYVSSCRRRGAGKSVTATLLPIFIL
jgi:hypothetical protein